MVYIYKKIVAGKPYYYLRISKRKGQRVIAKDIAYLGSDVQRAKQEVMNISKYRDEIKRSYRKINLFFETEHYFNKARDVKSKKDEFLGKKLIDVEACQLHYMEHFQRLDSKTKNEFIKEFSTHFSYNTTSLEGNTITLEEAKNLLDEGKTPKDRTLREIYDIQNTESVFTNLIGNKNDVSHNLIISIHKKLLMSHFL